jgi:Tol biopolymer transport system component
MPIEQQMARILTAVALVALLSLAVGCNGGGEALRTATPAPSPEATPAATATPQPTATATPTATAAAQLAFQDAEGAIWLVNADGSERSLLWEGPCPTAPLWSPSGDKMACVGFGGPGATATLILTIDGKTLATVPGGQPFAWSPTGQQFAYTTFAGTAPITSYSLTVAEADGRVVAQLDGVQLRFRWSLSGRQIATARAAGDELVIHDLQTKQERTIPGDFLPLAWVLDDEAMLVASNYEEQEFGADYAASLLDLATGEARRVPELDDSVHQFWLSPDSRALAFLSGPADRPDGGHTISVLDLTTLTVTPIQGSAIGFGSEWIPDDHLAFSKDGAQIYWADVVQTAATIHGANVDGTGLTTVSTFEGSSFAFSPDLDKMAHSGREYGGLATLWVASIDGSDARVLAEGIPRHVPPAAWRPTP